MESSKSVGTAIPGLELVNQPLGDGEMAVVDSAMEKDLIETPRLASDVSYAGLCTYAVSDRSDWGMSPFTPVNSVRDESAA